MKNSFDGLITRLDMAKKESVSLQLCQQKLPKWKLNEKEKEWEDRTEYLRTMGNYGKSNIYAMGGPGDRKE